MRFDFQQDTRLMQLFGGKGGGGNGSARTSAPSAPASSSTTASNPDEAINSQLDLDYTDVRKTSQAVKKAGDNATQEQKDAQKRAMEKLQVDAVNAKLTGAKLDAYNSFMKTYAQLYADQASKSQDLASQAGQTEFQAQQARIGKHLEVEGGAVNSRFALQLLPYKTQIQLFSTLKGFAGAITAIGEMFGQHWNIKTDWLDNKIADLESHLPNVDTRSIDSTDTGISSAHAIQGISDVSNTQRDLIATQAPSKTLGFGDSLSQNVEDNAPQPAHAVTTAAALASYDSLKATGAIRSDIDLSGVIKDAAKRDGNAANLTPQELSLVNAKARVKSDAPTASILVNALDITMRAPVASKPAAAPTGPTPAP